MRDQRGYTLAELLVVCAILGFIAGAIFTFQRQGQVAYLFGAARVEVQQNARLSLDMMLGELRSALSVTEPVANCNAGATDITFRDQNNNTVRYQLVGTDLRRTVTPPAGAATTDTIVGGVAAFTITCFDVTGAPTAGSAASPAIRSIRIAITTQSERGAAANQPGNQRAVVQGDVRLRNI
ncbi:MAG TPA: prepilin-type N-terminal cleavage/methylation domain-containing protein [Candidatus Tectomicrobia bacterium]|nr:prepilin-type N-terminal cleavage/methylation domain-containing protein [Candidatus Tectomicrobia bacterium]